MTSGATVLVLDDEPAVAASITALCEAAGHTARFTTDPDLFLELHHRWRPSHVLVDLRMPGADGIDVLAGLAEAGCAAGVIIASGVAPRVVDAAARFAEENGLRVVGVLAKPFGIAQLAQLLDAPDTDGGDGADPSPPGDPRRGPPPTLVALERALHDGEGITVAFQPKVRCDGRSLAGFEVLARWTHPRLGAVPPVRFVPLAEQNGLVDLLTDRVLEASLSWWAAQVDDERIRLSVNISAMSLEDPALVDRLGAHCDRHGVAPGSLILELTETSRLADPVRSLRVLTQLRLHGFQLSLDDFGTGYSTMSQLVRLPFSELKVDRSFVTTATTSHESRSVVTAVVELGTRMGLTTVAEGIEDEATLALVTDLGCELAQGFWIGRPLDRGTATAWLRTGR
ncbi:MAG: EAL domain-containing response regulator [Nocardioidaceae bacterium]